jgi:hypothetical protein
MPLNFLLRRHPLNPSDSFLTCVSDHDPTPRVIFQFKNTLCRIKGSDLNIILLMAADS